jgi:isoquinoline 1-oxidoreductase beta subunit
MSALEGAAADQRRVRLPYLAHAPMEPLNCTVRAQDGRAELWVGTQMPGLDGLAAAAVLGLPPQNVQVHVQMAGGGFGRRAIPSCDYVTEAAQVPRPPRPPASRRRCACCGAARTTSRAATTAPCTCTARIGFDARAASWPGTT